MSLDIKRGDIFYIDRFGLQTGSEQRAGRPGIIVSCKENNRFSETVEVVYLTTAPKAELPTHVKILSATRESTALCEQITTVSTEKLGNFIGQCTKEEMFQIDLALIRSLGIKIPELRDLQKELEIFAQEKRAAETDRNAKPPEPEKVDEPAKSVAEAEGRVADIMAYAKMEAERNMYKELYMELLGRVVPAR